MSEKKAAALCGLNLRNGACFGYRELKKALEAAGVPVREKAAFTSLEEDEAMVVCGRADDLRISTILAGNGASVCRTYPFIGSSAVSWAFP